MRNNQKSQIISTTPQKAFLSPLSPSVANVQASPEFVDHRGLTAMFGFSRAHAYRLAKAGKIRTVNLRESGKLKGRRLFEVASIRALLLSCIEGAEDHFSNND